MSPVRQGETFTESGPARGDRIQEAASCLLASVDFGVRLGLSPGFFTLCPWAANLLAPQSPLHVICKRGVMKSTLQAAVRGMR